MRVRNFTALLLCAACFACRSEQRAETVPPAAEAERGEVKIGQVVVVTGEVAGTPLSNGFFLRTPADEILFVATSEQVHTGEEVRATGPLERTDADTFREWRVDALEGKEQAEWELLDTYYIAATSVVKQ